MTFLALLSALALEYLRPLPARFRVYSWFAAYAGLLEHLFNAGERRHGVVAWVLAAVPLTVLAALCGRFLEAANPLLGLAWNAAVLYLSVGFKDFSHGAGEVAAALRHREFERARMELGAWTGRDTSSLSDVQTAGRAIEETLSGAYHHLFGAVAWFVLGGAAGVVAYRLATILGEKWGVAHDAETRDFGVFAGRMQYWMEWLPLRVTAISLAVMGDFEDALFCWRSQAAQWPAGIGVVLASGAGALGVKLGSPGQSGNGSQAEIGIGEEADADDVDSALSLVWRVLVMWLVVLLLLLLARWSGG